MRYGLIWHAMKMREKGFTLMIPPVLVREATLFGSGHFRADGKKFMKSATRLLWRPDPG